MYVDTVRGFLFLAAVEWLELMRQRSLAVRHLPDALLSRKRIGFGVGGLSPPYSQLIDDEVFAVQMEWIQKERPDLLRKQRAPRYKDRTATSKKRRQKRRAAGGRGGKKSA